MNDYKKSKFSRRQFLSRSVKGTTFLALAPTVDLFAKNEDWPADATEFKFHMIGHSHIDAVWLWPWSEGLSVVHSTFKSALDRMNETPDFKFTASSAQFYQWVADNDPEMLEEIRKRVDEGRWNIVGGWWLEPDVNIPGGEALVRQGLYGQLTFERLLGHRSKTGFNPDSFGHAGTLPQILKLQGMDNYVFMRPKAFERTLPADLFWWESQDGTRVLTYRIPISYNNPNPVKKRVKQILKSFHDQPMKSFMAFYGAGDHGGGATKENIKSIEDVQKEKNAPKLIFSTVDNYLEEVGSDKSLKLPVIKEDLQYHSVGCYTAEIEIKKMNRLSEAALITTEKIAAIGSIKWDANYPKSELTKAWYRVLFMQFHDSLAGTSLVEHSQTAREGYNYALDIANQAMYMAIQKLEWQVPTEDSESQYLLVFNPHAWEIKGVIDYDFFWEDENLSHVEDEKGNSLFHQWTAATTETVNRKKLLVETSIPPMGYRQIRLMNKKSTQHTETVKVIGNCLENKYLKVSVSDNGEIGIYDKSNRQEIFIGGKTGCKAVIINDQSDTWSHDVDVFSDEVGAFENAEIKILEQGPMRASIRVRTSYNNSLLTIDWILYANSRNLEAKVTLDWHEHLKMLKFSFPVDVESPTATYEVPYGYIVRENNGHEDPGQRWIDLTGKRNGKTCGLTLINDAKYGYNVQGKDMRISVARSAVFAHHRPRKIDLNAEHYWMDQGIHTFRMMLVPHQGNWREANISRVTEEFISLPVIIYQGIHGGTMPKTGSFLAVDKSNVVVTSVKQAETSEDVIIRCVETSGLSVKATVDLAFAGKKWTGNFRPCEIKTLRVNKDTNAVKEVNLLEE